MVWDGFSLLEHNVVDLDARGCMKPRLADGTMLSVQINECFDAGLELKGGRICSDPSDKDSTSSREKKAGTMTHK